MKNLSKRFISILVAFAFLGMSLVLYTSFIKPTYADIKAEQGRLAVINQKNAEYANVFEKLKGVLDSLKKSPDLQNRVSMAFPLSPNTSDSVNQITSIASANGLSIASIDVVEAPVIPALGGKAEAVSIVKGIGVLKSSMRVAGSYAQVKAFLRGVESSVRISGIKSFKIDRILNTPNPDSFIVTLEIETYYQIN